MAQTSTIEWTDVTWNPVHGCSKVSTGCKHCYAESLSLRYGQTTAPWTARNARQNVLLKPHKLREPLSKAGPWKNPCRVFVNSMSDLFHEEIPDEYIARVWTVMLRAPQHTFQVLTKRPERARDLLRRLFVTEDGYGEPVACFLPGQPMRYPAIAPNVWLGVSIENRKWVGRADVLRDIPAAVRFISAEPLLGPLLGPDGGLVDAVRSDHAFWRENMPDAPQLDLTGIDWLIVGGESGSGHRPFDPQWARDLREICGQHGTAFFVKQLGGARPGTKLEDLPEDLRSREMPA